MIVNWDVCFNTSNEGIVVCPFSMPGSPWDSGERDAKKPGNQSRGSNRGT